MMNDDGQQDLFDDTEASTINVPEVAVEAVQEPTQLEEPVIQEGDTPAETPNAEDPKPDNSEKMIPVHQFKAALKDVTDKLEKANARLAQIDAVPVPDRDTDPEGYDRHMRIEASKAVMADLVSDYDAVIAHYQEMAKTNPYLNEAVAAHAVPAKYAYDIAKQDMKLREVAEIAGSDRWKQFQEWEKQQAAAQPQSNPQGQEPVKKGNVTTLVPNLNRATATAPTKAQLVMDDNDELFKGKL